MKSIKETGRWNYKPRRIDMTGQRFGRLVVVAPAESDGVGRARWRCACDCGGTAVYRRAVLVAGEATSCGCGRKESARANGAIRHDRPEMDASGVALAECWR